MPDWSATKQHKARIRHYCSTCYRTIRVGEIYRRGTGFDEGTAYTWKDCAHCWYVVKAYDPQWDDGYNNDTFEEWAGGGARDVAELRMQAGFRHGWHTGRGNLWPLPVDPFAESGDSDAR